MSEIIETTDKDAVFIEKGIYVAAEKSRPESESESEPESEPEPESGPEINIIKVPKDGIPDWVKVLLLLGGVGAGYLYFKSQRKDEEEYFFISEMNEYLEGRDMQPISQEDYQLLMELVTLTFTDKEKQAALMLFHQKMSEDRETPLPGGFYSTFIPQIYERYATDEWEKYETIEALYEQSYDMYI